MAEEEKDDWLDDLDGDASDADDLDIDSLLPDADVPDLAGDLDSGDSDLDESDIDSLLADDDEPASADAAAKDAEPEAEPAQEAAKEEAVEEAGDSESEEDGELKASDIDALLAEADGSNPEDAAEGDPSQDDIDKLFSEVDDEEPEADDPFQAEGVDFEDVIGDDSEDESFTMDGTSNAFDAEEFGLDDELSDIPDFAEDDNEETTLFEGGGDESAPAGDDDATVLDGATETGDGEEGKKFALPFAIPVLLQDKRNMGIAGAGLLVLIIAAIFTFSGGDDSQQIAENDGQEQAEEVAQQEEVVEKAPLRPNSAPTAADGEFQFAPGSTELAVTLAALDLENDKLDYEILSLPDRGRLSGQPPNLIYLPNKDFSGEDVFVYRVSDGRALSEPATIKIIAAQTEVGKEVVAEIAVEATPAAVPTPKRKKKLRAKKLRIAAGNQTYTVRSTDDLFIDWEDIWARANNLPYSSKTKVEIISDTLHGRLKKLDNRQYQYRPDKYYGGKEVINYRFRLAKIKSKVRQIKINVKLGKPAPEIHLQKLAKSYAPGETVILDASASRDENRKSLTFSWQQLSGVPLMIEPVNEENSRVAFVVASTFNTVADPGPVVRLTVVDKTGKKDTQDIKVTTSTRRRTAVWRGLVGGGIAEDPVCPYGDCAGALLPWSYME